MNLARVLYDNPLKQSGVTVAYSGTETEGFNKENAYDYKDYSTFAPQVSTTTNLDFTLATQVDIDSWGIFCQKTSNSGTFTIRLYYESSPSTYTLLDTVTSCDGKLEFNTFSSVTVAASRNIRIQFELGIGPFYVRQIMVGEYLEMESGRGGQYVGVNPPLLTQGIIQTNNVSENGAILGTNRKRDAVRSNIQLEYLTESWVRNSWEPFALHASYGRGFFYQWAPTDYSSEVVYCVADKVNAPKNMAPTPLMSVNMPMLCRQPDP
jgi:hypothetical protein